MSGSAHQRPGRYLPWGLIGMLGLLIGVERQVNRLEPDLVTPHSLDWRQSGLAARGAARRCRIVCLGDSLVKLGVSPQVLQARLGHPVYNLAILSGYAPSSYFLFKRLIDSGSRPEAIVIDGEKLPEDPVANPGLWSELLNLRECLDLAKSAGDPSLAPRILIGQVLASYRERFEIRKSIAMALDGRSQSLRSINAIHQRNWQANLGGEILKPNGPADLRKVLAEYHPTASFCQPINASYVRRLLRLAEAHGIAVYWLLPPLRREIQALREDCGMDRGYTEALRDLQARHANLTVIDGRFSGYGPSAHADCVHLNADGAWIFSEDLADVLARKATTCRWITLPAYREPPGQNPLETIEQSRLALRQQWERRHR